MSSFKHIDISQTKAMLQEGNAVAMDIRDPQSYAMGHIDGALHLTNDNIQQVVTSTEASTPVIIYCYHGISSQQAAQYFANQGFTDVYSMDGGYEAWKQQNS